MDNRNQASPAGQQVMETWGYVLAFFTLAGPPTANAKHSVPQPTHEWCTRCAWLLCSDDRTDQVCRRKVGFSPYGCLECWKAVGSGDGFPCCETVWTRRIGAAWPVC